MLKTASSFVLGRASPCDVPQAYASVAALGLAGRPFRASHWDRTLKRPPASSLAWPILNVPLRVRLRYCLHLRPCWTTVLSILLGSNAETAPASFRVARSLRCTATVHLGCYPSCGFAGRPPEPSVQRSAPPPGDALQYSQVYFVSSLTRWPSSGRMSFSMASRTAFSEPGVEKRIRPWMMPAVARVMMAGEPMSW